MPDWKQVKDFLGMSTHPYESDEQKGAVESALQAVADEFSERALWVDVKEGRSPPEIGVAVVSDQARPDSGNTNSVSDVESILESQGGVEVIHTDSMGVWVQPR